MLCQKGHLCNFFFLLYLKRLSGGFVNYNMCCHLASDTEKTNALVVRVHGTMDPGFINRDMDVIGFQIGHSVGASQPVYATFKNGLVYRYAVGKKLEHEDLYDDNVIR